MASAALGSNLGLVAQAFQDAGFAPEPSSDDRWIGRRGPFVVRIDGDPVDTLTITVPAARAMTGVLDVGSRMAAPGSAAIFEDWTRRTLTGKKRRRPGLNAVLVAGTNQMRLQMLGRHAVVATWTRRT